MANSSHRYESGMMLPPETDREKWLEAQRILADIIDNAKGIECDENMLALRAHGNWINSDGEEKEFTLTRYTTYEGRYEDEYEDGKMETSYRLQVGKGTEGLIYCIDMGDSLDVTRKDDRYYPLDDCRQEVYEILSTVTVRAMPQDTHRRFEHIVASMAAKDMSIQMTAQLINLAPDEWDALVEEHKALRRQHARSRVHPMYLTHVAFNMMYQRQLEAAPSENT